MRQYYPGHIVQPRCRRPSERTPAAFEETVVRPCTVFDLLRLTSSLIANQALASFIEDCPDAALAEDAVSCLASLLPLAEAASRTVAAALAWLGGLGLVAPLLRRPRQALRVAGLRILAALLPLVGDAQGELRFVS